MRAQFIRGGDPTEIMDIGRYRSEGKDEDIFQKIYAESKKSPNFKEVTHIRNQVEPTFKIVSNFEKTVKKSFPAGESTYRDNERWTLYLTKDQGITLFDDLSDDEYAELTFEEFLKITKCREIKESQNFQRGVDPKKSMDIGMEHKFGRMYNLFTICHNLSMNSDSFEWVSDISWNPEDANNPYFNIESLFYYTDEDGGKVPEQFVIRLYPDGLEIYNVITKDEDEVRSVRRFIEVTSAYEEETARELGEYLKNF